MVEHHGYAAPMIGDTDPLNGDSQAGGYVAAGSMTAALGGRLRLASWLSLSGGLGYTDASDHEVSADEVTTIALALRARIPLRPGLDLIAVAGGWHIHVGEIVAGRSYLNGTATVNVDTQFSGSDDYVFGRLGLAVTIGPNDRLIATGEIGHDRWRTSGSAESLTAANPFPAAFGAGESRTGIAKLRVQWHRTWSGRIDSDLWGSAVRAFDQRLDFVAVVDGIGVLRPNAGAPRWYEYGLRLGYGISRRLRLDAFVSGVAGNGDLPSRAQTGVGVQFRF
jgi:hypothetical protein